MKNKAILLFHAALIAAALVLTAISSAMAYPLGNLLVIEVLGGIAVVLDVLLLCVKKDGLLRDVALVISVVLVTLCFCKVLTGRADLMGYVWFSDLEKGNPVAVNSLTLATIGMGGFLLAAIMTIISGFKKS